MFGIGTSRRAKRGIVREWRLHLQSVFSLSVAFVCLGASLLVVTNLRAIEERWSRAGRASIYLKDTATADEVEAFKNALAKVQGITAVKYVSSSEARAEFGVHELASDGQKGELAALPAEVFPASIEIDVSPDMPDAELTQIVSKVRLLPAVDDVETYQSWTARLARFVNGGMTAALMLAVVVFASVLAVIASTIRMALHRRKTEVEVLKLVGATDSFVRGPFVLEGTLQGAIGAASALCLLGLLFAVVRQHVDAELSALVGIEPSFLPWPVMLGLVVSGALLGALAALASLRKLVTV